MAPREERTEERLDQVLTRLDEDLRGLRREIQDLRTTIDTRYYKMQGRIAIRFDQLLHMLIAAILVIAILFAGN